jgi:hypothetical protein
MRIRVIILLVLLFPSISLAQSTVKLKEVTIFGQTIKLGQNADIVQHRIKADRFVTLGNSYGDICCYYTYKGITYIITYGTPKDGTGGYVVKQIEKVNKQETLTNAPSSVSTAVVTSSSTKLTREQVIEARSKFMVQVVSFDATQEFGTEFPYSDYMRLKITNGSRVVLSALTVLTKRFDTTGRMIGSSRAPAISIADLKPGQSAEVDYYPRGHLPGVKKMTVEIESLISPENERFFEELPK